MDINISERFNKWRQHKLEDDDLTNEMEKILTNEDAIAEYFFNDLEFGTGGLRGIIGVGTCRMNIYTVGRVTQGYSDYLKAHIVRPTVAIAYDSRIKSDLFARTAAEVLAGNGIEVYIYPEIMPTPALSFAIRYLGCSGGIVITASHNPANYNGYKVYGSDGSQITISVAEEISGFISQVDAFCDVKKSDYRNSVGEEVIHLIEDDVIDAYIEAVTSECLYSPKIDKELSIVYTPLNGTGGYCVIRALNELGFQNITIVKEQEKPDGNFTTCPYPNPEFMEAMELGIRYAKQIRSPLVLATDPDCDRVGAAVQSGSEYILLSGNEMGILLFDYICKRRLALNKMPAKPVAYKTIVTTDMAKKIADNYGVEMREVLTGFKFIGEQIGLLEQNGEKERFIFGFEESNGCLSGSYVRDKDGVNAVLLICEMIFYYDSMGLGLLEVLERLYHKYGYCLNTQHSYRFDNLGGAERMKKVMYHLRINIPESFGGQRVVSVVDYEKSNSKLPLPKSNVLKFELEDSSSVVIRPSGTEPKIKVYFSINAVNKNDAEVIERLVAEDVGNNIIFYAEIDLKDNNIH